MTYRARLDLVASELRAIWQIPPAPGNFQQFLRALSNNRRNSDATISTEEPSSNLADYMDQAENDFDSIINFVGFSSAMATVDNRPMDSSLADGTIRCRYKLSLKFDAYIERAQADKYKIHLSIGTLFALDDFFQRAFSNVAFFTHEPYAPFRRHWDGCKCFFAPPDIYPKKRFVNYDLTMNTKIGDDPIEGSKYEWYLFYPQFFSAIPLEAAERINTAAVCTQIALTWIVLHESAHYRCGHFEHANPTGISLFGRHKRKLGSTATGVGRESKAQEFQADILATQYTVDIFFNNGWARELPAYTKQEATWLARLIASTLGMVTLIVEKARQSGFDDKNYPSPMARLATIICVTVQRVKKHLSDHRRIYGAKNRSIFKEFYEFESAIIGGAMLDLSCAAQFLDETLKIGRSGDVLRKDNRGFRYPMPLYGDAEQIQPAVSDMFKISRAFGWAFESPAGVVTAWNGGRLNQLASLQADLTGQLRTLKARAWLSEIAELVLISSELSLTLSPAREAIRERHKNPHLQIVPGW